MTCGTMCHALLNIRMVVTRISVPYGVMQSTDILKEELVTLPKMWHVLIKEPGNEKIISRILDWILERA